MIKVGDKCCINGVEYEVIEIKKQDEVSSIVAFEITKLIKKHDKGEMRNE